MMALRVVLMLFVGMHGLHALCISCLARMDIILTGSVSPLVMAMALQLATECHRPMGIDFLSDGDALTPVALPSVG